MVYIMRFYVDGGCRGNGSPGSIGAAAVVMQKKWGREESWTRHLPRSDYEPPTNQKAEIEAIILALEIALQKYQNLDACPRLNVKIYSDSKYAIGCMTDWIYKWTQNGWTNAAGNPVANQDRIRKASDFDDDLKMLGSVEYIWIPRSENMDADRYCNDAMDQQL